MRPGSPARAPSPGPLSEAAEAQASPPRPAGLRHRWLSDAPAPAVTVVPDPDAPPPVCGDTEERPAAVRVLKDRTAARERLVPGEHPGRPALADVRGFQGPFAQQAPSCWWTRRWTAVTTPFHSCKERWPRLDELPAPGAQSLGQRKRPMLTTQLKKATPLNPTKPGKRKGSGSRTTEDAAKSVSPKPSPSAPSAGEGGPRTGEGQRTPLRAQLSPRPLGDPDSFQPSPCHLGGRAWGVATSSQGSDLACRLRLQRSIVFLAQ